VSVTLRANGCAALVTASEDTDVSAVERANGSAARVTASLLVLVSAVERGCAATVEAASLDADVSAVLRG
jgi:hypothetical protein